jgi:16S rRNA G966 N2-methylase RsmD
VTKIFAEGRARDEDGWLVYPRDTQLRRQMFSPELADAIMTHPAKQQAHLHRDICEYVSESGDTILDPFGGVGTTLVSAALGRNVILIEIEDYYVAIIRRCIAELASLDGVGQMTVIQSDNRLAMPVPCDHIITSPPYGNDLAKEAESAGLTDTIGAQGMQYTKANQNIGKLQPFIYKQAMNKVYDLMVKSVKVGGTITITHRDRMRDGERILYIESIVSTLVKLGCSVDTLDKWKAPGSMATAVNKSMGLDVVEDEDVIIMRRVK